MAIKLVKKPLEVPIHCFGKSKVEGAASQKELLGGKGANLCEMASLGVPVPPGFIIPTTMCLKYLAADTADKKEAFVEILTKSLKRGMDFILKEKGGPALVSVRSGARVSMPGMMDTILNVGLDPNTYPMWEEKLGAECATNCFERLVDMYGDVVHGQKKGTFPAEALPGAEDQLIGAVLAVFESWNNPRAIEYRKINGIPDTWGTAVVIQSMVFGNLGPDSCTGVLFSRNPSTGEPLITGEFLVNAQGEDVVAGIRTPEPLTQLPEWDLSISTQLFDIVWKLEEHYKDMQDVEFTVEDSKLYILQTRSGKRAAKAAFEIAYDMAMSGLISKKEAAARITPKALKAAMTDYIDPSFKVEPDLVGIAAGGNVVTGVAVFSSESAVNCKEPCILITDETSPDDIAGMNASVGILTATGGLTSHAAVVARGMNKACVVGAADLTVSGTIAAVKGGVSFNDKAKVTIDGSTGNVWVNKEVPVIKGGVTKKIMTLISWATGKEGSPVTVYLEKDMSVDEMTAAVENMGDYLYIETAPLFGIESKPFNAVNSTQMLYRLRMATKGKKVVLNFTPYEAVMSEGDSVFYSMFGDKGTSYLAACNKAAEAMIEWPADDLARFTASGNVPTVITKSGKVKASVNVKSVADLFLANGPLNVSEFVMEEVFGGKEYYQQLVEMIFDKTGKDLSGEVASGYYWYEYLNGESNALSANA